jgi:hypothetical protein
MWRITEGGGVKNRKCRADGLNLLSEKGDNSVWPVGDGGRGWRSP